MRNVQITFLLSFFSVSIVLAQSNIYPTSGNVKIFATDESWGEGLVIVKPAGYSGVRFTRSNPVSGNYNGNWAIGYNTNTGNDFSFSTNYNGVQYDGVLHISNATRNVGIGTVTPAAPLHVKGSGNTHHIAIETNVGGEGDLQWFQGGSNGVHRRAALQIDAASGDFEGWVFNHSNNWQKWLRVKRSNGYVGIGTSSP